MNRSVKLIKNLFTHGIPIIKLVVNELRSVKFSAIFLVSVTLVGVLSLSPGISSLDRVVLRSSGRIAGQQAYVTAMSGSAEDIQAAVDEVAAMGGGGVYIPEGTFNFFPVDGTWESVDVPPGVNIIGAGMVDENIVFDETNQTDNWKTILKLPYEYPTGVGDASDQYEFFELRNPSKITDKGNRLSGFAIVGYRDELLAQGADPMDYPFPTFKAIKIFGVVNFRIDHLLVKDAGGGAVDIKNEYGPEYYGQGVIDHCKFINVAGWGCASDHPRGYGDRTVGYGVSFRWAWGTPQSRWDPDISSIIGHYDRTVFIEDCYFQRWRHCISANANGHLVFRYNHIRNDCAYDSVDFHGSDGSYLGTRAYEVYNNVIEDPHPYDPRNCIRPTGGGGVIFGNILRDYDGGISLQTRASTPEICMIHDLWIWGNTYENIGTPFSSSSDHQENVDYFLRAPSVAQDGFEYTPYPYPHPLAVEQG